MHLCRDNFFVRFGTGQPEALTEREERYRLGMPNSSGEAFPPLTNMEDKLDELEAERERLFDMCPKDKQPTYDGKRVDVGKDYPSVPSERIRCSAKRGTQLSTFP